MHLTTATTLTIISLAASSALPSNEYLDDALYARNADPNGLTDFLKHVGHALEGGAKDYAHGFKQGYEKRAAHPDPNKFTDFFKDVGHAIKGGAGDYATGFKQGYEKRDLAALLARSAEADPNVWSWIKKTAPEVMTAEGRMGGAFVHGMLGRRELLDAREAEAEANVVSSVENWWHKNGETVEKGIGHGEAEFMKHLIGRNAAAEAEAEASFWSTLKQDVPKVLEAEGRMGGAFVHGMLGRREAEAEAEANILNSVKNWWGRNGETVEKGIGHGEAEFMKHLIGRDAEAEAEADPDVWGLYERDGEFDYEY